MSSPNTFAQRSVFNVFFDADANRIIGNALLATPGEIQPSLLGLHVNIFNGAQVTEYQLSRAKILEEIVLDSSLVSVLVIIPWSQKNVSLSLVFIEKHFDGSDYVLDQRYAPFASATPLSITNNPDPVVLTNLNTQVLSAGTTTGTVQISNITLNVKLGSNGGAPYKFYNVYQTITSPTGNVTTVTTNQTITAQMALAGTFNVAVATIDNLVPESIVNLSVSVDNSDGLESAISNAVSIAASVRPLPPSLLTALSGQQSSTQGSPYITTTVGLNRDELSMWNTLTIQFSTDGTSWSNGVSAANNAALLAELNQFGFITLNQTSLVAQTGYFLRAVLSTGAPSTSLPIPATQSLPSSVLQAMPNIPLQSTSITVQPEFVSQSNSYTFTTTITANYNGISLLAQFQLVQNGVVVQTVILPQAQGATIVPPVFTLAASAVQPTDTFVVNMMYFNYLSSIQAAFYANPLPQVLNGTPIIVLVNVRSPSMIVPPSPSQLPQPASMAISQIAVGNVQALLDEFVSPSFSLLPIASVDYQVSLFSNFSTLLALRNGNLSVTTFNVPVSDGQVQEAQIIQLFSGSVAANTLYYVQARFNFAYGSATINGNWTAAQIVTAPIPPPAGPTGFGLARLANTNILDASWNAAVSITYNNLTFVPSKYIIGFYDEVGALAQQNIVNFAAGVAVVNSQYNVPSAILDQFFSARVVTVYANAGTGAQLTSAQSLSNSVQMVIPPVVTSVVVTETATTISIVATINAGRNDSGLTVTALVPYQNGQTQDFCANMSFNSANNTYVTGTLQKIANPSTYENLRVYISAWNVAGMGYASWP